MKAATLRLLPAVRPGITLTVVVVAESLFQFQSQSSIKACQAADKNIVNCGCILCSIIAKKRIEKEEDTH